MGQVQSREASDRDWVAPITSDRLPSSFLAWGQATREGLPTLLLILALEGLNRLGVAIPNPQLFLAVAICIAAFRGGWAGGLVAATFGVANAVYFFSLPGDLFAYSTTGLSKVVVNALTLPAIAALTATLAHRVAEGEHKRALSFFKDAEAPIILLERDGTVLSWNRGMTRLTGISAREAQARPIGHLVQSGDRPPLDQALTAILEGNTSLPLVLRFPLPGTSLDRPARLSCSFHPNRTETGHLAGVIMVGQALPATPVSQGTTDTRTDTP